MLSQLEYGIAKENRPNRQADRFAGSVLPLAASLTHKPNIMKPIPTDTFQPAILPQVFETEIKSTCTGRIYRIQTATLGEMPSEELNALDRFGIMSEGARKISGLITAGTRLKEYQAKVKAKVEAAAENVAKQAKKGGLSDSAAEAIRKQILGIAS